MSEYTLINVVPHRKNENWRGVRLEGPKGEFDAVCFGPQPDKLEKQKPLPDGWTVEQGQYGPILRYPKTSPQGGAGRAIAPSWRNTEPGFRYEQKQMNRRTALMQAVALFGPDHDAMGDAVVSLANEFFLWLERE